MFDIITLYNDECYNILEKLEPQSQHLVLIDPPFGQSGCEWDTPLDMDRIWNQLDRIMVKNGVVAIFGQEPFSTSVRCSNIKDYRYDWYWVKNNATNPWMARRRPMRVVENIMIFYKRQPTYNPQMRKGSPYTWNSTRSKGEAGNIQKADNNKIVNKGERFPIDTLYVAQERGLHPTQKPVALLESIIKTYTNEGENVIDFCMGSCSSGVACKNTNRNFIGVEKDDKIFEIAKKRIDV